MIEGSGSDDWRTLKAMRHARPDLLHRILEVNARAVAAYLDAQVQAGAQVVMIFDTWGGVLAHDDYEAFSLAYSRKVLAQVKSAPRILFTKGGLPWLEAMIASGADAIGLDWTADPRTARKLAAGRVALQGNLDPAALFAPEKAVREAARKVLDSFGAAPGHVFNLGHGILPGTPIQSVAALADEVRTYSRAMRNGGAQPSDKIHNAS
jgi:uroporphyrinogen decarboxylase